MKNLSRIRIISLLLTVAYTIIMATLAFCTFVLEAGIMPYYDRPTASLFCAMVVLAIPFYAIMFVLFHSEN